MVHFKKLFALCMTLILLASPFTTINAASAADTPSFQSISVSETTYVRIKNQWQGTYLYEANNKVNYGFTAITDHTSEWSIEDFNGHQRIKNRATGHYITSEHQIDVATPLESIAVEDSWLSAQWIVADASNAGFKTFQSVSNSGYNLNVQMQNGYAQANNWAQLGWGSAQWLLEPVSEIAPVRILNSWKGTYLFESEGKVKYGTPTLNDQSAQWYIEDYNGHQRIKNRATGHYITTMLPDDVGAPLESIALQSSGLKAEWIIADASNAGYKTIQSVSHSGYSLNVQMQNEYAQSNDWAQLSWGSAQWKLEPASDVTSVKRIKNQFIGMYLYEDENGKVSYGSPAYTDPNSHWIIEDFNGNKRLKNLATGHYISMQNKVDDGTSLESIAIQDNWLSAQWVIALALDGGGNEVENYSTIQSATAANLFINVQMANDFAQSNNWAQATWGSAQWKLEDPAPDDVVVNPAAEYIRIKNDFLELYLYEDAGIVKYGNKAADDLSAQWLIEDFDGNKRIKNRQTGHYINKEGVTSARQALKATEVEDSWSSAKWVIVSYAGVKEIHNVNDDNADINNQQYIHVENQLKVAQYSTIPRDWGSPKWVFVPVVEVNKPVRLKNNYRGNYLYEEDGKVKYGTPDVMSPESHWLIEDVNGKKRIKNIATGHYMAVEHNTAHTDPVESIVVEDSWTSAKWNIADANNAGFKVFTNVYKDTYRIHEEDQTGYAQASDIPADWGSAQWALEVAPELPPVIPAGNIRIKNRESGKYLYENKSNVVLYGTLDSKDAASHWRVESVGGVQRIKNKETGHYMSIENQESYLESLSVADPNDKTAQWVIESAPAAGHYLIRSNTNTDEYIHAKDSLGFPQYGLRSIESGWVQWDFEAASEETLPSAEDGANINTTTNTFAYSNYVKIRNKASQDYLFEADNKVTYGNPSIQNTSFQWLIEDSNGYKQLKNRASGHYMSIARLQGFIETGNKVKGALGEQWRIKGYAGFQEIESVLQPNQLIFQNSTQAYAQYGAIDPQSNTAQWLLEDVVSDVKYEAEDAFFTGGVQISAANKKFTGAGYTDHFNAEGANLIFSVNAQKAGNYTASIRYANLTGSSKQLSLYVNGMKKGQAVFTATEQADSWGKLPITLSLRSGINTVSLQYDTADTGMIAVDGLTLFDSIDKVYRGATLPYLTYEAEHGKTNAEVLASSRKYQEISSEASGRQAVRLDQTGQYVEFTLAKPTNTLVVRYSIPDSVNGEGLNNTLGLYVNGVRTQSLNLTSKYSWLYGKYPYGNNPAEADAHRFYDELHVNVSEIPAGATIKLQKDQSDTADFYVIDFVETELIAPAITAPNGMTSVLNYGAIANDGLDDTDAFKAAISAAQTDNQELWIPAGEFQLNQGPLDVVNITLHGAGMWYTTLKGAGLMGMGSRIRVYDLLIDVDVTARHDELKEAAFDGLFGTGSIIQNVWVEHAKVGLWTNLETTNYQATDGLYIVGSRIRNTYADGINLDTGTKHSIIEQTQFRNTGDDSIAIWSDPKGRSDEESQTFDNTVRFNTVQLPSLADNIAVFGGKDNKIQDNIILDTVGFGAGITISTRFNPVAFSGTTLVERNTLIRAGGHEFNWNADFGGIWIFTGDKSINSDIQINDNNIFDSSFQGLSVLGPNAVNKDSNNKLSIKNLVIDKTGTWGVSVGDTVTGTAYMDNVIIRNAKVGELFNAAGVKFATKTLNEGYAGTKKAWGVTLGNVENGPFVMELNTEDQASAEYVDSDGNLSLITAQTTFSVNNSAVAEVSSSGSIIAKSVGTTVINAVYCASARAFTLEVKDSSIPSWNNYKLTATEVNERSLTLQWPAALVKGGDESYRISWNAQSIVVTGTTRVITGLNPNSHYTFTVEVQDASGVWGDNVLTLDINTASAPTTNNSTPIVTSVVTPVITPTDTNQVAAPAKDIRFKVGDVMANDTKLAEAAAGKQKSIVFEADPTKNSAEIEFSFDAIQKIADGKSAATITIIYQNTSYELPINIKDILANNNTLPFDLTNSKIKIIIGKVNAATEGEINSKASEVGMKLMFTPIEYKIIVQSGDKSAELKQFGSTYVSRTITMDGVIDGKTATAVVFDPATGLFRYIPALFMTENGKTIITIKSNSNSIYSVGVHSKTFEDIKSHWAKTDIELLSAKMIVNGLSEASFAPNQKVTRAEFAALLVRALGFTANGASPSFKDVAVTDWYASAVQIAAQYKLILGYEDGTFGPNQTVTREQMAIMVARALRFTNFKQSETTTANSSALSKFKDSNKISSWAQSEVGDLLSKGIMQGQSATTFVPQNTGTRAEAVVILKHMLQTMELIN
jgi:hypothetical protein